MDLADPIEVLRIDFGLRGLCGGSHFLEIAE
jgi:hypothetical protein